MFNKRGTVLNFCQGIASGLAHLHRRDYAVPDLAARCVQVTAAMSVKVSELDSVKSASLSVIYLDLHAAKVSHYFQYPYTTHTHMLSVTISSAKKRAQDSDEANFMTL